MKNLKEKKGISLIVLIITIIVMIILAAAIILSLNNSGIIDRANKAKTDSDAANLKEYANVLIAEWEIMTAEEKEATNCSSSIEYVNAKFKEKGYENKTYSADGDIYTDLPEMAKNAIVQGLKIGDEVKYTIAEEDKKEYEMTSKLGVIQSDVFTTQTDLTWIYIGVNDEGKLLISSSEPTNHYVYIFGISGFLYGPSEFDTICGELYTVEGKGNARSMNIDDVTRLLGYTGEKGSYYDASGTYTPTAEPVAIAELESKYGQLPYRKTPTEQDEEKSDLGKYKADYYTINKSKDINKMNNSKYVDLIFLNEYYWLASTAVYIRFQSMPAGLQTVFYSRLVTPGEVSGDWLYFANGSSYGETNCYLRPVVTLTSAIQKYTENGETIWDFVSKKNNK